MNKEDEETVAFQNWLWGRLHPLEFSIIWAPVSYREIGLICGVTESTVQHWFSDPNCRSHREPADKYQRLLAITDWFLSTFDLTPQQLTLEFDQDWCSVD